MTELQPIGAALGDWRSKLARLQADAPKEQDGYKPDHDCVFGMVYADTQRQLDARHIHDDGMRAQYANAKFATPCPICAFRRLTRWNFGGHRMTWQNWQDTPGKKYQVQEFKDWNPKDQNQICTFYGNEEPHNCRNGKTHLMAATAHALMTKHGAVRYKNASDLGGAAWENNIDDLADMPGHLLLDDLGNEQDSKGVADIIDRMIDRRWRAGRPTVITTKLTMQSIGQKYRRSGARMMSCTCIEWVVSSWD